jgi:hypothetical protein
MAATQEHTDAGGQALKPQPASWHYTKPATDAAALRDIRHDLSHLYEKAEQIRQAPEEFRPRLVVSDHVRGSSILDKIADSVNRICGSPSASSRGCSWAISSALTRHHGRCCSRS